METEGVFTVTNLVAKRTGAGRANDGISGGCSGSYRDGRGCRTARRPCVGRGTEAVRVVLCPEQIVTVAGEIETDGVVFTVMVGGCWMFSGFGYAIGIAGHHAGDGVSVLDSVQ